MKKILSLILTLSLAIMVFGIARVTVDAADFNYTNIAADFDTTLEEKAAVRFDSAFGLEAWANEYTAVSVEATSDGGYIAAGHVVVDGWSWIKAELIKYDADYNVEFTYSLDTGWWNFINAVAQDSNGDYWIFASEEVIDDN
jgi:hypothetical protein